MSAPRLTRRRANGGYTLIELLLGIALASIFAVGLFGFFFSSTTANTTQQSQSLAQQQGRDAVDRMTRELRQAFSPNNGLWPPIERISPTDVVFFVDHTVTPGGSATPVKVRYRITDGKLVREQAREVSPGTYGSYSGAEVVVDKVANDTVPLVTAVTEAGALLPPIAVMPTTKDADLVNIRLVVGFGSGQYQSTVEFRSNVAPRNPRKRTV